MRARIVRLADGDFELRTWPPWAARVLEEVVVLAGPEFPDEKARSRLFPVPGGEGAEGAEDWKRHAHPELFALFASSRDVVAADLAASERGKRGGLRKMRIPRAHVAAWIAALNAARLQLGAAHEIDADALRAPLAELPPSLRVIVVRIDLLGELQYHLIGATQDAAPAAAPEPQAAPEPSAPDAPPGAPAAPASRPRGRSAGVRRPRIGAVIVFTRDLDGLAEFYAQALGVGPPDVVRPRHRGWNLDGGYFGIDAAGKLALAAPGGTTAWFAFEDVDAAYRRFLAAGARSRRRPSNAPWGERLASVDDPDGNVVGLSGPPRARSGKRSRAPRRP